MLERHIAVPLPYCDFDCIDLRPAAALVENGVCPQTGGKLAETTEDRQEWSAMSAEEKRRTG
jgi:hypothetical protein